MLYRTPFKTARELGLSDVNYVGLLRVLQGFDNGTINETNFNMTGWSSCICGWGRRLTKDWALPAFSPHPPPILASLFAYDDINSGYLKSPQECTAVLRNYLLTGDIDWTLAAHALA